ncbi:hypothetical protein [Pseudolactococcus insecticola]|uniref:Uncharacterized protein n=1 Tax=Pseudolactococcus insecticola TaxID=2709158 RepID=A0A6A0B6Q8_9LACT|nr:hypothetical protein [Lactococcus insecticola]GFH41020.1 hypothetical protein Hs20B_14180 [Lactococcus insecticola]
MKKMSDDAYEKKIQHMRELYLENHDKSELSAHMVAKLSFLDHFRSRENQKARLRRQLSELEIKRCRATLDRKSSQKFEQKLAMKKALFKRLLDEK